jgi:hypothetical protein
MQAPRSRYEVISSLRHVQLLGRTIDLNSLIAQVGGGGRVRVRVRALRSDPPQRINTYMRENVEHAIARFEAQDITAVIELENSLRCARLAHRLMSELFSLDRCVGVAA